MYDLPVGTSSLCQAEGAPRDEGAGFVFDDTPTPEVLLEGTMVRDQLAALAQVILGVTGAAVVLASWGERRRANHAEYYALLATSGAGMVFFVGADGLMTLFLGL